ncbi:hypothetical protein SFC27_10980 [Bacillus licheniformis]|uniref:Phage capsid protein n=3 Tax=Bacillus subtilis group TaxID=653685 RepID=A0A8B5YA35_BACLI|nr:MULTISPECIES: hypothetical protein [Bacillus]ARC58724.1 hypothetical protein BaDB11_00054 [Bacillus licheniformis]EQM25298.1 hypothetical protein N399_23885 [Bacillus licheniformis CG-B52]KND06221.1 hypothetical protein ACJ43_17780 [Bacillus paralicheniformis]MBK4208885.1 hypothetical protein [Bacillus licheniformis]MBW7632545.1 hypothetical protein [Bacillus licheniformis]
MKLDTVKIKGLFSRVVNNKMEATDKSDIETYIKKVFGDGTVTPDPSMLHQFNTLVVQQADEIAKPMVTNLITLFANHEQEKPGSLKLIKIPKKNKAKVIWSANGSGVDLVRVEGRENVPAVPYTLSTGFYYEPLDLVTDSVEYFNKLVNDIANAKVRLYLDKIHQLTAAAIAKGKIPPKNVAVGSNLTLQKYNEVASVLQRYGGRPVFVGDSLLIDYFAFQQATDSTYKNLLTDGIKNELLTALNPTTIGRTTAVNLTNPFTDETNSKVELPVNKGYMFAGGVSQKPFSIVEYGGLKQLTEQDIEDERIKMKITQSASVNLLFGEAIGIIEEQAAVSI